MPEPPQRTPIYSNLPLYLSGWAFHFVSIFHLQSCRYAQRPVPLVETEPHRLQNLRPMNELTQGSPVLDFHPADFRCFPAETRLTPMNGSDGDVFLYSFIQWSPPTSEKSGQRSISFTPCVWQQGNLQYLPDSGPSGPGLRSLV